MALVDMVFLAMIFVSPGRTSVCQAPLRWKTVRSKGRPHEDTRPVTLQLSRIELVYLQA